MQLLHPDRLRLKRELAGRSQRKFALLVECSQTMLYKLESGEKTGCSEDLAVRICRELGLELEDLFDVPWSSPASTVSDGPQTDDQREAS